MGKGGGGGTTVTKTEPWDGQKKYLNTAMAAASKLYNNGNLKNSALAPAYYSGNTVAPQSAWTQQALKMQANAALNMANDPTMKAANAAAQRIAGGQALQNNAAIKNLYGYSGNAINKGNAALNVLNELSQNDNPYMDTLYRRANNQAQASLDSNFNRSGRYGSGSHEAAAADAANNLADQMYSNLYNQRINAANAASQSYLQGMNEGINAQQAAGNLYNTGIGQQAAAAQIGQQLANQRYTDAAMLSEAGGVQDDYKQQLINAAIEKYNYEAQRPLQALSTYNQLIQGSYGGTTNATGQQSSGSRLGNALGGALGGAGLIGATVSNPAGWMLGGGAALGGLLGLL